MKSCLSIAVVVSILLTVHGHGQEKTWTLGQFRSKYLGQSVLILHGHDISGSLGGWQPVLQNRDGSFRSDFDSGAFISFKYKDQIARIIAIQQYGTKAAQTNTNIMGESISDDDAVDASIRIYVQFEDGRLAEYLSMPSLITDERVTTVAKSCRPLCSSDQDRWGMELLLTSERDAHAAIITQNLPSIIGQRVYAISQSLLFGPDITPDDILNLGGYGKRLNNVPLLTPMTVVAANYNPRYDFIAWKLRLPDGREIMSASRYRDDPASNFGNDNSFLGRSIGSLLMAIPQKLTSREIEAIKGRRIFRGMSRRAVFYSWGVATENDYGRGGKQMVYGDNQFVYLDLDGKVTDWQSLR